MLEFLEKKETKTAGIIIAVIFLTVAIVMLSDQSTIKQTKDSYTHEAGRELLLEAGDFFEADGEVLDQMQIDTSAINVNKTGTYEATVTHKNKKYTIDVNVADTTAPEVEFAQRYVFTNDASNVDFSGMIESTADASECTVKLIRFERMENLGVMDEDTLKKLTDAVNTHAKEVELKSLGTENIPEEEGIYISRKTKEHFDRNATYIVSQCLGHNRLSVSVNHYLI